MLNPRFEGVMQRLAAAPAPPRGFDFVRWNDDEADMLMCRIPIQEETAASTLTQAERDVIALIFAGCSNQEIGEARGTSARTVANQIQSIFRKLGVQSRAELVATSALFRSDAPRRI
jgi:DNA-binding CsgD family transcriptional regulator